METFCVVTAGAWLSVTVMVCAQEAVFPDGSVTVQTTVVLPNGNTEGALLVVEAMEQLSLLVGLPNVTLEAVQIPLSEDTETLEGQVMVGLILSITVTVAVAEAEFPWASVTVKFTVFAPRSAQLKFVFDKLNPKVPEQLSEEPLFTAAAVVVAAPDEFK